MIRCLPPVVLATLLVLGSAADISATSPQCTAVGLQRGSTVLLAKNLDWKLATGLLVTHGRDAGLGRRYGSVTCNQLGADRPLGGVNEVGLVVEELSYAPARYPDPGERPTVDELSWVQWQLDRHATVAEVLADLDSVAIVHRWFGLHYILADRTGDVAVVEFLDGRAVIHHGDDLPAPVLANDTYARSVRYLRDHAGFGGDRRETDGPESPERFVRAARGAARFATDTTGGDPVSGASAILDDVRQVDTRWSIVYQTRRPALHVRVAGVPGTRTVVLADLDLTPSGEPLAMDLTGELTAGPDRSWVPWTPDLERRLRVRVRDTLGLDRTDETMTAAARLPAAAVDPPPLEIRHLQNAGVWIGHGERALLIDALFDLTVAPGRPPRLHDHLPADSLAAFLEGGLGLGCVDAAFATHDHDDHHQRGPAQTYRGHCPDAVLALPAAIAPDDVGVVPISLECGDAVLGEAGPIRFTALGLRHGGGDRPHLGYAVHLGAWDVLHLGDADASPATLATLDRVAGCGRRVILAPCWYLTDEPGRSWLRERSRAEVVVLLHANRGNIGEVKQAMADHASMMPPLILGWDRLELALPAD